MTSKERFLTAIQNKIPDRVPVTPDISNYIPVARRGGPFWEVYFEGAEPLWKLYIDAAEYFGLDMWIGSCSGVPVVADGPEPRIELKSAATKQEAQDTHQRLVHISRDYCVLSRRGSVGFILHELVYGQGRATGPPASTLTTAE